MKNTFGTVCGILLFACMAFLFWREAYPAHLHFHEQFQMFQYSPRYFSETLALPGGLAHYISRFLIQFYYSEFWGAFVAAWLVVMVQLSMLLLLYASPWRNVRYSTTFLTVLPAIAVWGFMLNKDAMPTLVIAVLLSLWFAAVGIKIHNRILRWIYEIVLTCLLFVIAGGGFCTFIGLMAGWEIMQFLRDKDGLGVFVTLLMAIVLWTVIPAVGTLAYPYPFAALFSGVGYYRYPDVSYPYKDVALCVTVAVGIYLMSGSSCKYFEERKCGMWALTFCIVFFSGYYLIRLTDLQEEVVFEYDYLTRMGRWNEILKKASKKTPETEWEQCCVNLALAQNGHLCDCMFAYPSQRRESLLPFYRLDYMSPLFGGEPYYYMGQVNTAQRFAFEAMEAIPDYQKSGRCYQRLVMTNLVNGRHQVAAGYLRILERTLYYRKWALQMKRFLYNDSLVESDSVMGKMRQVRLKEDLFFDETHVELFLSKQLLENSSNEVAWQYFFALCLLNKKVALLADYVALYLQHSPNGRLPVHVQEALVIWWAQRTKQLEDFPWNIEENVKKRFVDFMRMANQAPEVAERSIKRYLSGTFWCYAYTNERR